MARCTPIPMEEWQQAPKVSLRSVIEHSNCQIPVYSEDTDIISVSEEESEAPVMWVNNGAYCLSHSGDCFVSERVAAAPDTLATVFSPLWQDCNLLYCRRCYHSRYVLGSLYRSYMSETTTGVLGQLLVVNLGDSLSFQRKQSFLFVLNRPTQC